MEWRAKVASLFLAESLRDGESDRAEPARSHRHPKHRLPFWLVIKQQIPSSPLSSRLPLCILSYALCERGQLAGQLLSMFSWNPEGSASLARSR